ncbi:MAG TPA: hypothetical protein VKV26_00130 [Dehalococcoidia bacterium]|nr:hypothetical protein [Dehalococcoidia bacterium]
MIELLTVDEASARYANQWLLMRVHEYNEYQNPFRGEILTVGKHRSDIHEAELAAVAEALRTGGSIYVFRSRYRVAPRPPGSALSGNAAKPARHRDNGQR